MFDALLRAGTVGVAVVIRDGCFHGRAWQVECRAVSRIGGGRSRAIGEASPLARMPEHKPAAAIGSRGARAHQPGNDDEDEIHFARSGFSLASTAALAQGNTVGGNSHSGGPAPKRADDNLNDSTATGGAAMKNGAAGTTTGSSRLSPKDAGAVDKNGDATSPGGTMKK